MADELIDPFDAPVQRGAAQPTSAQPSTSGAQMVDPFDEGRPSRFESALARAPLKETQGRAVGREPDVLPGKGGLGLAFKQGMVIDPPTQLRLAAEHLFPNDPKAIERFGFVNGRVAFETDDGQLQYATGKAQDVAGGLIANIPEMVSGAVGSLSASPVVGGALGVAGARGLKRAAAGIFLDEPQTIEGNLKDIGKEAAIEGATGGLTKGALVLANRGRSINFAPRDLNAAQATQARIKANTGIEADLALASGDRRLLGVRNYLAQQPNAGADMLQRADELSAEQFGKAADSLLDKVAQGAPADTLGAKGVNAAREIITSTKRRISDEVRPLYEAAYARAPVISDAKIMALLEVPPVQRALRDAREIMNLDAGKVAFTDSASGAKQAGDVMSRRFKVNETQAKQPVSLQLLDYTKRSLDDEIEQLAAHGDNNKARALAGARDKIKSYLDSVASPEYQQARERFAELTKAQVEPLENSVVGVIAKIKDSKTATVAAKLFRDQNVTPGEIARARSALSTEDPEAWNALVRQFLSNELNAARKVTQAGSEVNVAGKFHQRIWGDPEGRKRMGAALGPDASDALKGLMEAAETLGQSPIRGSNTQANQAIAKTLEGPSAWWARVLLKPRESFLEAAQQKAVDQNATRLVEALTNPAKVRQLKIATKISDPARRAAFITSTLATQTERGVAGGSQP